MCMFGLELLACCADLERRPASMQMMGVRFARIGTTYLKPTSEANSSAGQYRGVGRPCFLLLVLVTRLLLVLVAFCMFVCLLMGDRCSDLLLLYFALREEAIKTLGS